MPDIIACSRSISAAQSRLGLPTWMWCALSRSISSSACAAATSTFFGMQPRLGQVPPSRSGSIIATVCLASRVATVTPIPALPPPRSCVSALLCPP